MSPTQSQVRPMTPSEPREEWEADFDKLFRTFFFPASSGKVKDFISQVEKDAEQRGYDRAKRELQQIYGGQG